MKEVFLKLLFPDVVRQMEEMQSTIRQEATNNVANNRKIKILETSLKEAEDILIILSHDIRSKVGSISSLSELMTSDVDILSVENVQLITKTCKNLMALFGSVLGLYQNNEGSPVQAEFNLSEQLLRQLQEFKPMAVAKEIDLIWSISEINILSCPYLIERLMDNLIVNAIKHTPSRGTVEVRAYTVMKEVSGLEVKLEVIDTGSGVPESVLQKDLSSGTYSVSPGQKTFGLRMIWKVCRDLGGKIEYIPNDWGSTFKVSLPIV